MERLASIFATVFIAFVAFVGYFAASSNVASAMAIEAGLGMVDEMDDRPQPAVTLRLEWGEGWFTDFVFFGRDYGPVSERTYVLAPGYKFKITGTERVFFRVGLSLLDQRTSLYEDAASKADPKAPKPIIANDYNCGVLLGVEYDLFIKGPLRVNLNWDAHLYPAGYSVLWTLAFGRKEVLSASVGLDL